MNRKAEACPYFKRLALSDLVILMRKSWLRKRIQRKRPSSATTLQLILALFLTPYWQEYPRRQKTQL
jgi:hypothetical protein